MRKNNLKLYTLLFISFSTSILFSQTGIDGYVQNLKKTKNIALYYSHLDRELLGLSIPSELDNYEALNEYLHTKKYHIIQYNPNQWVITPIEFAGMSYEKYMLAQEAKNKNLASRSTNSAKLVIGQEADYNPQLSYTLSGKIIEDKTNNPVIGATIVDLATEQGATSNESGNFQLSLTSGYHDLEVKGFGLEPTLLAVFIYQDGSSDVRMLDASINLAEVVISERNKDANVREVLGGVEQLTMKEIKKLPAFMGEVDVFKSMLTLPGVSSAGEGVGGLNIRGANTDQNLIIQDDIVFFNASHALGFFSLFHPDLVDDIKLYKGNVPAKYGGRLSSVLNTTSKVGDNKEWGITGGIGLTSSKLSIEGPIVKDKVSLSVGSRLSTINWLLGRINVPSVQSSKVNFHDVQGKLHVKLSEKSSMGFQAITAFDDVKLGNEVRFNYTTNAYSAYFKSSIKNRDFLSLRVTKGTYDSGLDDQLLKNPSLFKTGVDYVSSRLDYTIKEGTPSKIDLGVEAILYDINNGQIIPANAESQVVTKSTDIEQALEVGLFAEKEHKLSEKLSMVGGVRVSLYGILGGKDFRYYSNDKVFNDQNFLSKEFIEKGKVAQRYTAIEPRFSVNYTLDPSSSIKASYNRMYQYIIQISNSLAASPIDYWKLSDNNIKPLSANTVSLGYFKNFQNNAWESSVEVYYRTLNNTNDYKDFADLIANNQLEKQLLFGKGKNYGIETSLRKVIGQLTTRIGYTYARSLKQIKNEDPKNTINFGNWYSSNYDKPHDVQFLLNYNPTQRFSINVNFNYNTGRPVSAPDGKFNDWNAQGIPIFESRNNYRIPDYHRMDVSMNIFPGYRTDKRWKSSWTFGVYNVYSRKNPYSVYFRQETINSLKGYQLSILGSAFPFITYNFLFK
jgi:hypothetical protein